MCGKLEVVEKPPKLNFKFKLKNINASKRLRTFQTRKNHKTVLRVEISKDEKGEAVQQTLLVI